MTTYPYTTDDGIIQLVRKDDHAAVVQELNERLTKQQADRLDTIVQLRAELTRWQSLAERLTFALGWHHQWRKSDQKKEAYSAKEGYDESACCNSTKKALAAYESAAKGEQP